MLRKSSLAAFAVVLLLAFSAAFAATIETTKVTKAAGGSTGDSCKVAPDTSATVVIDAKATTWYVVCFADSATSYRTVVSLDGTHWFSVDFDSVTAGTIESTADLGKQYAGYGVRVIQDNLSAAGAAYGNAVVVEER
jgi:hypothetical protein